MSKTLTAWLGLALAAAGTLPATASDRTIIFLHNAWYEGHKAGEPHPKFGAYDLAGITAALAEGGAVEAPVRGPDADPSEAADALTARIREAIADGQDPDKITVIGASKGAFIAQLASARLGEPAVSWVLVGGCHTARMEAGAPPAMTGRVLSIYEASDRIAGACAPHGALYANAQAFEEQETKTGLDHGFQFVADPVWITPALAW
ncbi:MAG: hypothetical protein ACFBSD_11415 [Paracoccaceae bacterium]